MKKRAAPERQLVSALFTTVQQHPELFCQWYDRFVAQHGRLNTQRKTNFTQWAGRYGLTLKQDEDRFRLIFSVQGLYVVNLLRMANAALFHRPLAAGKLANNTTWQQAGLLNYLSPNHYLTLLQHTLPAVNHYLASAPVSRSNPRDLYLELIPSPVRHSLGEYYTATWLSKRVIEEITNRDAFNHRQTFLDPACGSGVFLTAITDALQQETGGNIFRQVYGIDCNPLAVLAAKTAYLQAWKRYFGSIPTEGLFLPVVEADTLLETDRLTAGGIPQTDYIVGNPPWVNWEYLGEGYRERTRSLWEHYHLFTARGMDAGFVKEDISALFTYVSASKLLKPGGTLAFLLKTSLLKSVKQGQGFRMFTLPDHTKLAPEKVISLEQAKPFEGVQTPCVLALLQKGAELRYPVTWEVLTPGEPGRPAVKQTLMARPSKTSDPTSGWTTSDASDPVYGTAPERYRPRTGVFCGGSNAVFQFTITGNTGGAVSAENYLGKARNKVEQVSVQLEKDYLYPLITGRDIGFWQVGYERYILCPHTAQTRMYPVGTDELPPLTRRHLLHFEPVLRARKGFTSMDRSIHQQHFYTLQRIGKYTFAPYKVAWKYISKTFTPVVIEPVTDPFLGKRVPLINEKVIFIGLENRHEAYYLCGILSANRYRRAIESTMMSTQVSPGIVMNLDIPVYEPQNTQHVTISQLCEQGHQAAKEKIPDVLREINQQMQ